MYYSHYIIFNDIINYFKVWYILVGVIYTDYYNLTFISKSIEFLLMTCHWDEHMMGYHFAVFP